MIAVRYVRRARELTQRMSHDGHEAGRLKLSQRPTPHRHSAGRHGTTKARRLNCSSKELALYARERLRTDKSKFSPNSRGVEVEPATLRLLTVVRLGVVAIGAGKS